MSEELSETSIVRALADTVAKRVSRRVIVALQKMKHTLSGDDSELKTTWDEICVQVQYEESFSWDVYDETVRGLLSGLIQELAQHEREAIWLQTDSGVDWSYEEPEDREVYPAIDDEIIDYIAQEYVYFEAGRWSNPRIRSFNDRSSLRD